MVSVRAERLDAREKVIRCALEVVATERRLADEDGSVTALDAAETALELACRDLTAVVSELTPQDQPKGWAA